MNDHYYIGLDVHKKSITYVIKTNEGTLVRQGSVSATRGPTTGKDSRRVLALGRRKRRSVE